MTTYVSEETLVAKLENKKIDPQDIKSTPIWSEIEMEFESDEISREDYERAYKNFVRNMDGVDTSFKVMAMYHAVYEEIDKNKHLDETHCVCGQQIDSRRFAEEFVDSYHELMLKKKIELTGNVATKLYNIARRKWASAVLTLLKDTIPTIQGYVSTSPEKLNKSEKFPYYINENEKGRVKVYHQSCYEKHKIDEDEN